MNINRNITNGSYQKKHHHVRKFLTTALVSGVILTTTATTVVYAKPVENDGTPNVTITSSIRKPSERFSSREIKRQKYILDLAIRMARGDFGSGQNRFQELSSKGYDTQTVDEAQTYVDRIYRNHMYPCVYLMFADSATGDVYGTEFLKYNTTSTVTQEPTREGYLFTGWYTDQECEEEYDMQTLVSGSNIIYAGWTEDLLNPAAEQAEADTDTSVIIYEEEVPADQPVEEQTTAVQPEEEEINTETEEAEEQTSADQTEAESEPAPEAEAKPETEPETTAESLSNPQTIKGMQNYLMTVCKVARGDYRSGSERTSNLYSMGYTDADIDNIQTLVDGIYQEKKMFCLYLLYADAETGKILGYEFVKSGTAPTDMPKKETLNGETDYRWYTLDDKNKKQTVDINDPMYNSQTWYLDNGHSEKVVEEAEEDVEEETTEAETEPESETIPETTMEEETTAIFEEETTTEPETITEPEIEPETETLPSEEETTEPAVLDAGLDMDNTTVQEETESPADEEETVVEEDTSVDADTADVAEVTSDAEEDIAENEADVSDNEEEIAEGNEELSDPEQEAETELSAIDKQDQYLETICRVARGLYGTGNERPERLRADGYTDAEIDDIQTQVDDIYRNRKMYCLHIVYADATTDTVIGWELLKVDTSPISIPDVETLYKDRFLGWYYDKELTKPVDTSSPVGESEIWYVKTSPEAEDMTPDTGGSIAEDNTETEEELTEAETEIEAKSEIEAESEAEAEIETETKPEAETEPETVSEPETEPAVEQEEETEEESAVQEEESTEADTDSISGMYINRLQIADLEIEWDMTAYQGDKENVIDMAKEADPTCSYGNNILISQNAGNKLQNLTAGMKATIRFSDGTESTYICLAAEKGDNDFTLSNILKDITENEGEHQDIRQIFIYELQPDETIIGSEWQII